jgi:hypothetical protein
VTLRCFTLAFAASELYRRMLISKSLRSHRNGLSITVLGPVQSPTIVGRGARQSRACKSLPLQTLRSRIEAVLLGDTEP